MCNTCSIYNLIDIQVLSEIVSIAEIKAEKASSSIDLIALLAACSDVSKKYQIDPHKDSFYYRALLRMSLNAKESNWWEKLKQDINVRGFMINLYIMHILIKFV